MWATEQTPVCKCFKLCLPQALGVGWRPLGEKRQARSLSGERLWKVEGIRDREARSNQRGSRRCLTNLSQYRWTLNLFVGWARKGRRLLRHLPRLRVPATFCARLSRTYATSFIKHMVCWICL